VPYIVNSFCRYVFRQYLHRNVPRRLLWEPYADMLPAMDRSNSASLRSFSVPCHQRNTVTASLPCSALLVRYLVSVVTPGDCSMTAHPLPRRLYGLVCANKTIHHVKHVVQVEGLGDVVGDLQRRRVVSSVS